MTPGEASKLRGLLMWLDTGLLGRPCRGALSAVIARQYWEHAPNHQITPPLARALRYLHTATTTIPPRIVPLHTGDRDHVLLYTDAATNTPGLRIGILLVDKSRKPFCASTREAHISFNRKNTKGQQQKGNSAQRKIMQNKA